MRWRGKSGGLLEAALGKRMWNERGRRWIGVSEQLDEDGECQCIVEPAKNLKISCQRLAAGDHQFQRKRHVL